MWTKRAIRDIAKELDQLAQKARDRKLSADELRAAHLQFLIKGAIGGAHFTPIVNKPEVAILGMGRGAMKPVVRGEKIEAAHDDATGVVLRPSCDRWR
jgi:pyruvate dehydrogenase E2 component (dihydrolipoamide acetyltransferase)